MTRRNTRTMRAKATADERRRTARQRRQDIKELERMLRNRKNKGK